MDPSTNRNSISATANANASLMRESETKRKKADTGPTSRLPDVVLEKILSYTPVRDQAQANRVSHRWKTISQSPRLSIHALRQLEKMARSEVQILKTWSGGEAYATPLKFNFCSEGYIGLQLSNCPETPTDIPCIIHRKELAEVQGLPKAARIVERQGNIVYLLDQQQDTTVLHLVDIQKATRVRRCKLGKQEKQLWLFSYDKDRIAIVGGSGKISLWDISKKHAVCTKSVNDPQIKCVVDAWKIGDFLFIRGDEFKGQSRNYHNGCTLPTLAHFQPSHGSRLKPACYGNDCLAYGPGVSRIDQNGQMRKVWKTPLGDFTGDVCTNGKEVMAIYSSNIVKFFDFHTGANLFAKEMNFPKSAEAPVRTTAILKERIAVYTVNGSNVKIIDLASRRCFTTHVKIATDPEQSAQDGFYELCDALPLKDELLLLMRGRFTENAVMFHMVRLGTDRLLPAINEPENREGSDKNGATPQQSQKRCIVM